MKITLKEDWDIPSYFSDKQETDEEDNIQGHFVGREKELNALTNELVRKNHGSILICGHRGVGKTTFVNKALQIASGKCEETNIVFVSLDASSFSTSDDTNRQILVNLIRRLYTVFPPLPKGKKQPENLEDLKEKVARLYIKAVSDEFRQKEEISDNNLIETETIFTKIFSLSSEKISPIQILIPLFLVIGTIFQFTTITQLGEVWQKIISILLLAPPIPMFLAFEIERKRSNHKRQQHISSSQTLYTLDDNISNLEYDLEQIHSELSKENFKIVYVIDELDKISEEKKEQKEQEGQEGQEEPTVIDGIFKYFKNLFTLSYAIFIFIGDENLMAKYSFEKEYQTDQLDTPRPLNYTYFTSKYFLARPTTEELSEFLDEITQFDKSDKSVNQFETIKKALILEANCDYFDLIDTIRGYINEYSGNSPIINIEDNLNFSHKGIVQEIVSQLLEKYLSETPSLWGENETNIRAMYYFANQFLTYSPEDTITFDYQGNSIGKTKLLYFDLYRSLYRLGMINLISQDVFRTTEEFPDILPKLASFQSEKEIKLNDEIDKFFNIIMNFWNFNALLINIKERTHVEVKNDPFTYSLNLHSDEFDIRTHIKMVSDIYKNITDPTKIVDNKKIAEYILEVTEAKEIIVSNLHDIFSQYLLRIIKGEVELTSFDKIQTISDTLWLHIQDDMEKNNRKYQLLKFKKRDSILLICNGSIANENIPGISMQQILQEWKLVHLQPDTDSVNGYRLPEIKIDFTKYYSLSELEKFVNFIASEEKQKYY